MKKFMTAVTAVSLSAMMLAGCGKADVQESTVQESTAAETEAATETESETKVYPDEAYLDGINLGDFVELGDYKGVDVTVTKAEVTDEMVDQYIQSVLDSNKNKEEVDRAVKDGDVVDIKYVGKKDGVEFDGGSSDSYELTIGSNTFIDGFEDGVIGMKKDETKDLNLTFPEDYSNTDLEGCICRYRLQNISFQLCFLLALGRAHQVIINVLTIFCYCAYAVNIAGCYESIVQNRVSFFINMIYRYREYNVCTSKVCIAVILREGKV